jgi:trehalose synthase
MDGARVIDVSPLELQRLSTVIGPRRFSEVQQAVRLVRKEMGAARLWNISSTAKGGGVAEMLLSLLGYARAAEVDARWLVIDGSPEFFAVTKRIHNRIHGMAGDNGALGSGELRCYQEVLEANAPSILAKLVPGDIVLLHDPQTLGLAEFLAESGVTVVWRCHIGSDTVNAYTKEAWEFLAPFVRLCRSLIFSRAAFVPPQLEGELIRVIPPSIDPFSDKNRKLTRTETMHALRSMGLLASDRIRRGTSSNSPRLVGYEPGFVASDRLVAQVSRWDHLKDMQGVMSGFAQNVTARSDAVLALVGPATAKISDDPEGEVVLGECVAIWESFKPSVRRRIHLFTLPMDNLRTNAVMVNAVQTHATIVVQKSLMEGFGLTVTEALWKTKPVVGSSVGGINDQLADGAGMLLSDPKDLGAFSMAVVSLLEDQEAARVMAQRGHDRVLHHYLVDRQLLQYARLIQDLVRSDAPGDSSRSSAV